MREVYIDASKKQLKTEFAGYAGEHNESKLIVKLPSNMVNSTYSYKFVFGTSYGEKYERIPNSNDGNGTVSCMLEADYMRRGTLEAQVEAYTTETDSSTSEVVYTLIAKTDVIKLIVKGSVEGQETETEKVPASKAEELQQYVDKQDDVTLATAKSYTDTISENKADKDYVSNAIKGTGTGTALTFNDVSPINHKVDLSGTAGSTVNVYGKNLSIVNTVLSTQNGNLYLSKNLAPNQTYTFSAIWASNVEEKNGKMMINFKNKPGGTQYKSMIWQNLTVGQRITCSFTVTDTTLYMNLAWFGNELQEIQLELGNTATDFEAYKTPKTITLDENGKGEANSVSPNMTVISDSEVSVAYNRDINGVLDDLSNEDTEIKTDLTKKTAYGLGVAGLYNENNELLKSWDKLIADRDITVVDNEITSCKSLLAGKLIIDSSITSIRDDVFSGCESLASITIPDSITSIGSYEFQDCTSLKSITIPNSVTSIGDDAFYNCISLTSVTIGNGVTTINYSAFGSCTSLTDVYYKGTKTQWNAITINSHNEPLINATIHYELTNEVYNKIDSKADKTYVDTQDLALGQRIDNLQGNKAEQSQVDSIAEGLGNVQESKADKTYVEEKFNGLSNTYLKKTDASSTYLTKSTASNTYLTKTTANSAYLTKSAASKTYLSKDMYPVIKGVKSGHSYVIDDISPVNNTLKFTMHSGSWCYIIGKNLLLSNIESGIVISGEEWYSDFMWCILPQNYSYKLVINGEHWIDGLTARIEFYDNDYGLLGSAYTSDGNINIGDYGSWFDVTNHASKGTAYIKINFIYPSSSFTLNSLMITLQSLSYDYKEYNSHISGFYPYSEVPYNISGAYPTALILGEADLYTTTEYYRDIGSIAEGLTNKVDKSDVDKQLSITSSNPIANKSVMDGLTPIIEILKLDGIYIIGVASSSIDANAFKDNTDIKKASIANSVTSIGQLAFYRCYSLTNIILPINLTSIGSFAFYWCKSLTSITIPNGVTSIGESIFNGCTSLTSITIPDSVTSIGNWAFYACESLTSVKIPDSVTSIGRYAFEKCKSLTSVTIPNNVTSIGDGVFSNCTSLTNVTIGSDFNASLNISSGSYTADVMVAMFNNLKDLTGDTAKTLTLGSTNLAKLTDEQKAIATNKNWNLA